MYFYYRDVMFFVPSCGVLGKETRGAGNGERDSCGTENFGLTLPSTFQEWNRTSAWTGNSYEIPVKLAHNSQNRDY